jgi:hypothetical protein
MAITTKTYTYPITTDPYLISKLFHTLKKITSSYAAEVKFEAESYTISAPGLYFRAIDRMVMDCI